VKLTSVRRSPDRDVQHPRHASVLGPLPEPLPAPRLRRAVGQRRHGQRAVDRRASGRPPEERRRQARHGAVSVPGPGAGPRPRTTYITMQPPLPAGAWDATVQKMINDFGAAIPEESAGQIVTYLQAHYAPGNREQ
jgi:hypothetical protein